MNLGGFRDEEAGAGVRSGGGREMMQSMEEADAILQRHLPSVCTICGKRTRDEGRLRGHMSAKHKFPKPFRCKICHKEFCYNSVYRRHMKQNHAGYV